MKEQGNII